MTTSQDSNLNPDDELCVGCGEVATGYAFIEDDRYCHGDDRSCYERECSRIVGLNRLIDDLGINRRSNR